MNKKGFTLVEVIVVTAIVAILAGIMIPFAYRAWESSERDETRQKMRDIKKAMIGDTSMVQNGLRTNFGFVGECGRLPQDISDLLTPADMLFHDRCKDNAPYMPAGFDSSKYGKDAWGTPFSFSVAAADPAGRIGTLRSSGADRVSGTADDINETTDPDLQIYEQEVTPAFKISGSASFILTNGSLSSKNANRFYLSLEATYVGPVNPSAKKASKCLQLPSADIGVSVTQTVSLNIDTEFADALPLPVGKSLFKCRMHDSDASCGTGTIVASTADTAVFIADNIKYIVVPCPSISHTVTGL